jgi:2-polyprenyl-6-methoxyphenol hydroxylase-like FAD-dependent oxidoreductase
MAGLGVNLGWSDVVNLTDTLEITVKEGGDLGKNYYFIILMYILGSLVYLKNFDTKSQRRNVPIMTAIDFLNSLFSTNFPPSVFLRSLGVNFLDSLWPAKV